MVLAVPKTKTKNLVTAEELLQLQDNTINYELTKGELIEMTPPGGSHGLTAVEISWLLRSFVKSRELGVILVETGFKLKTDPDTVRAPDVSFIAAENLPPEGVPDGYIAGPPDLAVEIVSPGDKAADVQDKVQEYLECSVKLVWVVYPQQQIVIAHHPDGMARTLKLNDTLTAETVIPGFSCLVKDIFR